MGHDRALERVITSLVKDDTQLFRMFMDNPTFKSWLTERMFDATYYEERAG